MDHSQVIKYFDEYIKKYSPYQDNETYLALMEYISQTFTKELYENIPTQFKQLYEDNYIDIDMYDILLRNIGVPDKILSKLKINEKIILFKNFTDFYRYRGDVYFFDKVSKLFEGSDTSFDIYELYIDYDEDIRDWVFKPYKLIKNTSLELLTDNIRYDQIYDNIPSFLITRQQLTTHKNNKEIILPVKSNILLLDYSFAYSLNEMMNLVNATFLTQFQRKEITCYFIADEFTFTLKEFFIIWYYILLRCYDSSIGDVPLQWIIEYIDSSNPYTLSNIDEILEEYKLVTTALQSRNFYEKYISRPFKNFTYSAPHESTDFEYLLTFDFIEYIDVRLAGSIMDDKQVYSMILDELLNSLVLDISTTFDEYYVKYSEYFINSLTRITLDPKLTSSYLLMHNYKPYHTELLSSYNEIIFSNSRFDLVTPDASKIQFLYDMQMVDVCTALDYSITNLVYNSFDNCPIAENNTSKIMTTLQNNYNINEIKSINSRFNIENIYNQFDLSKIDIHLTSLFQLLLPDRATVNSTQLAFNNLTKNDSFLFENLFKNTVRYPLLDMIVNNIMMSYYSNKLNFVDTFNIPCSFSIYEDGTIINGDFIFGFSIDKIMVSNLSDYVTTGAGFTNIGDIVKYVGFGSILSTGLSGLTVGDKVKYITDDDSHYRTIVDFNLELNSIQLDKGYTGGDEIGDLVKLSTISDNALFKTLFHSFSPNYIIDHVYSIFYNLSHFSINSIVDLNSLMYNLMIADDLIIEDVSKFNFIIKSILSQVLLDIFNSSIKSKYYSNKLNFDKLNLLHTVPKTTLYSQSDSNLFEFIIKSISSLTITDNIFVDIIKQLLSIITFCDAINITYSLLPIENFESLSKFNFELLLKNIYNYNTIYDKNNINQQFNKLSIAELLDVQFIELKSNYTDGGTIIDDDFNFSTSTDRISIFNLDKYIGLGIGGLNIGDKIKYILDEDIHYRTIRSFNLSYSYIQLDSKYTGSNVVGKLAKLSQFSDNIVFDCFYYLYSINYINDYLNLFSYNLVKSENETLQDCYKCLSIYSNELNCNIVEQYLITHILPSLIITITENSGNIEISCSNENVEIFFTTDGSTPSFTDLKYISPFVNEYSTIKAIAYSLNDSDYTSYSNVGIYI